MKIILLLSLALLPMVSMAQTDAGLWTSIGVDKKINKKFSVGLEGEFRSRNDFKTADRWSVGLDATYKINKWLKASAGYSLLNSNYREKIEYYNTYDNAGTVKYQKVHWRPSYWGQKHRIYASFTSTYKFSFGLKLSLRERWQYTYRPEQDDVTRWTWRVSDGYGKTVYPNVRLDKDYVRKGKAENVLRSRFQVEYDIPSCTWTPYASVELYNTPSIKDVLSCFWIPSASVQFYNAWSESQKVRYTIGADWKINKQNSFGIYYRFQNDRGSDDDDDSNMNIVGLSYNFTF